jgi:hypothetical protein
LLMHVLYQVKQCCGPASLDDLSASVCANTRTEQADLMKRRRARNSGIPGTLSITPPRPPEPFAPCNMLARQLSSAN